ncbi:hypothetical protein ElyMa_000991000 [Elysia marginata]|uniref:Uncharacterized protein n=1 Tax=Elysia marginata TaxID=1093978 RepID=A0AAV4HIX1_9GAST|nr:hypothetical protein ElyMa_000991000 [Elysia marginata]
MLKDAITKISGLGAIDKDKITISRDTDAGTITITISGYGPDKVITLSGYQVKAQTDAIVDINSEGIPNEDPSGGKDLFNAILAARDKAINEIVNAPDQAAIDAAKNDGLSAIRAAVAKYNDYLAQVVANNNSRQALANLKTALETALGKKVVKSTKTKAELDAINLDSITKDSFHTALGISQDLSTVTELN